MKLLKGVLSILAVGLFLVSADSLAGARVVNCDKGDSLQKAIESGAGSAAPVEIQLLGTCYETFMFTRDRVTINGDGNTTIVGHLRIFSSDQVYFGDLNITGPNPGVTVFNGRVRFVRVNVMGNEGAGVYARQGASVNFVDSRINDNHGEFGVLLEEAYLVLNNTEVIGNWGHGIMASRNSSVSLGNNSTVHANQGDGIQTRTSSTVEATNSHIWGNRDVGISMRSGSAGEIHDSAINANGQRGLEVAGNSTLDVFGGMVGWNGEHGVWLTEHSLLKLIDAQVSYNLGHGLVIARDGGVVLEGNSWIDDNTDASFQVVCQGMEASIEIVPPAHAGPMDCPDADF
jgi:hypothetical protein